MIRPVHTLIAILALSVASPTLAGAPWCARVGIDAQPRCKKGCPCGNSCISCSKTCRVGVGTATGVASPEPAPTPPKALMASGVADSNAKIYRGQWFGSSVNRFYFRAGCRIVPLLAIGDQVLLPDSAAAEQVGFRRLILPGC